MHIFFPCAVAAAVTVAARLLTRMATVGLRNSYTCSVIHSTDEEEEEKEFCDNRLCITRCCEVQRSTGAEEGRQRWSVAEERQDLAYLL
jgi:hypothetical protein